MAPVDLATRRGVTEERSVRTEPRRRTTAAALTAGLLLALYAPPVLADARSTARRAFQRGMKALEAQDYATAISAFESANEAVPHPDVQYNLARACADAGRYAEAIRWFEVYLEQRSAPPDRREVEAAIRTLKARLTAPLDVGGGTSEPPREPAEPVEPGAGATPAELRADVERLRKTAADLRALSPQRAEDLDAIARRMLGLARAEPIGPPAPPGPALEPPAPDPGPTPAPVALLTEREVREVEDYEEREVVTAATREAAAPADAPAVVWVITQREIRERGYESVAEALRSVAGLHVIDDHVFVDVGVRGVHGGLRGQSRLIKVLIDGQPVSFRPTNGNLLGPELIPIRAVERIELIRGPASALYGANAFLGVLQIVTRRGGDIRGGSVAGRWGINTSAVGTSGRAINPSSGSGDFVLGTRSGALSVLLSGSLGAHDRSGLRVPESSPLAASLGAARGEVSIDDRATPLSLFGRVDHELAGGGQLSLSGGLSRLRANAEWLDLGALTHFNQVSIVNLWLRLELDLPIQPNLGLTTFLAYTQGAPTDGHRFRPLRPSAVEPNESRHLVERFGSRAVYTGAELRWDPSERLGLRFGADLDVDVQDLVSTDVVFDAPFGVYLAGDRAPVPEAQQGTQTFTNGGVYAQASTRPVDWIDVVAGLRFDYNNLYAENVNGRLGTVFRLGSGFHLKALYGSAYRAPAPDQLFHGAAYLGDTIGCQNFAPCQRVGLQPQIAHTGELVLGFDLDDHLSVQLTGFLSYVDDLIISFPTRGETFVTTNAGSYLARGLELEANGRLPDGPSWLRVSGRAYLAIQDTAADIPETQFDPPESIRDEFREASLFPALTAGGGLDLGFPTARLGLYLEGRYVGARRASGSNLGLGGSYEDGQLPPWFELDANLSTRDLYLLGEGETVLSLRVTDVVGQRHAEGGFRGWDVPTLGRTLFLRLIQEF